MKFLNLARKQIQFKSFQTPILVIGTKADLVDDAQRLKQLNRGGNIGMIKIENRHFQLKYNSFILIFSFS